MDEKAGAGGLEIQAWLSAKAEGRLSMACHFVLVAGLLARREDAE